MKTKKEFKEKYGEHTIIEIEGRKYIQWYKEWIEAGKPMSEEEKDAEISVALYLKGRAA